jgi:hypothetical protein
LLLHVKLLDWLTLLRRKSFLLIFIIFFCFVSVLFQLIFFPSGVGSSAALGDGARHRPGSLRRRDGTATGRVLRGAEPRAGEPYLTGLGSGEEVGVMCANEILKDVSFLLLVRV